MARRRLRSLFQPAPQPAAPAPEAGASGASGASGAPAVQAVHAGSARTTEALLDPRTGADVESAIPFSLRVAAGVSWRLAAVVLACWGLFKGLEATTTIVIPVAVALLLTALLMPVQVLLNRRLGLARHLAGAITVLGALVVLIAAVGLAGNQLVTGIAALSDRMKQAVAQIQNWLTTGPLQLGGDQINEFIDQGRAWLQAHSSQLTSGAMSVGSSAGEFGAGTLIALVTTFFFLSEGDRIWAWCVRLLPRPAQSPVYEAFRRGWVSLGSYVKTQVLVAFIDALFISLGALALGLPLIVPLGLIIFLASAVPIVGAVVSGALAVLLALVVNGFTSAIIMLVIVLAVQQIEGHILQPLLMGKAVSLHPLAVLLGVAAGSFLMGIVGALFAVPIIAVTNTVVLYLKGHDKFPALAQGASAVEHSAKQLTTTDGGSDDVPAPHRAKAKIGDVSPATIDARERLDDAARKGEADDVKAIPDR